MALFSGISLTKPIPDWDEGISVNKGGAASLSFSLDLVQEDKPIRLNRIIA